jgi:raffinose/stachyose/melibiose transport system substrate-binding protein
LNGYAPEMAIGFVYKKVLDIQWLLLNNPYPEQNIGFILLLSRNLISGLYYFRRIGMKKMGLIVLALLSGSVLVFAGGNKEAAGSGSGGASVKPQVVTVLFTKNTNMDAFQAIFEEIEKKYNIKTEVELRVGGGEGETIVKTRLATGDMADAFLFNSGAKINDINPERNCLDLSGEPLAARLTDTFKTAASSNGKLYGVPVGYSSDGGAWLYNKKVYQELGLQVPRTWKELLANCDKILAAGKVPVIGSYKETWTSQYIFLAEEYYIKSAMPNWPQEYTSNRSKYATNMPALRSFEKLSEISKYLNRDYLATTLDQATEMLATGQGAHFAFGTGRLNNIDNDYPDKINDIGVFAQPGDDPNNQGITAWMPNLLFIYKNSPNIEAVKKWFEYIVSEEAYTIYSRMMKPSGPPVLKGINLPTDAMPGVKDMQQYFNSGKVALALEYESPVKGPNLEQLCIEVFTNRMSPRDAAIAYDQDVTKQAVLLNLPGW